MLHFVRCSRSSAEWRSRRFVREVCFVVKMRSRRKVLLLAKAAALFSLAVGLRGGAAENSAPGVGMMTTGYPPDGVAQPASVKNEARKPMSEEKRAQQSVDGNIEAGNPDSAGRGEKVENSGGSDQSTLIDKNRDKGVTSSNGGGNDDSKNNSSRSSRNKGNAETSGGQDNQGTEGGTISGKKISNKTGSGSTGDDSNQKTDTDLRSSEAVKSGKGANPSGNAHEGKETNDQSGDDASGTIGEQRTGGQPKKQSFLSAFSAARTSRKKPEKKKPHHQPHRFLNELEDMEEYKKYVVQVAAVRKLSRVLNEVSRSLKQAVSDLLDDFNRERLREARERLSMITQDIELINDEDMEDRNKVGSYMRGAERRKMNMALQALRSSRLKHENELRSLMQEARDVKEEIDMIKKSVENQPKSLEGKLETLQSLDEPLDLGRAVDSRSGALSLSSLSKVGEGLRTANSLQKAVFNDLNWMSKKSESSDQHDRFLKDVEHTASYFNSGNLYDSEISGLLASSGNDANFIGSVLNGYDLPNQHSHSASASSPGFAFDFSAMPSMAAERSQKEFAVRSPHRHTDHAAHNDVVDHQILHDNDDAQNHNTGGDEDFESHGFFYDHPFFDTIRLAFSDSIPAHHFGVETTAPKQHPPSAGEAGEVGEAGEAGEAGEEKEKDTGNLSSFLEKRRQERNRRFGKLPRQKHQQTSFLSVNEQSMGKLASSVTTTTSSDPPVFGAIKPLSLLQQKSTRLQRERRLNSSLSNEQEDERKGQEKPVLSHLLRHSHVQLHETVAEDSKGTGTEEGSKAQDGDDETSKEEKTQEEAGEKADDGAPHATDEGGDAEGGDAEAGSDLEQEKEHLAENQKGENKVKDGEANDESHPTTQKEHEKAEEEAEKKVHQKAEEEAEKKVHKRAEAQEGTQGAESASHEKGDRQPGKEEKNDKSESHDGTAKKEKKHSRTFSDENKSSECLELAEEKCSATDECFYDPEYFQCLTDCSKLSHAACEKVLECHFETEVPENSCVNQGYQSKKPTGQSFDGIMRGCEEVVSKTVCERLGKSSDAAREMQKKPAHKCHWLKVNEMGDVATEYKKMEERAGIKKSKMSIEDRCIDLMDNPSANQLILAASVAKRQEDLDEEAKKGLAGNNGGGNFLVCLQPNHDTMELSPDKPYYSLGEKVEVRCKKGHVLVGAEWIMECKKSGTMEPTIACVAQGALNEIERGALSQSEKMTTGKGEVGAGFSLQPSGMPVIVALGILGQLVLASS